MSAVRQTVDSRGETAEKHDYLLTIFFSIDFALKRVKSCRAILFFYLSFLVRWSRQLSQTKVSLVFSFFFAEFLFDKNVVCVTLQLWAHWALDEKKWWLQKEKKQKYERKVQFTHFIFTYVSDNTFGRSGVRREVEKRNRTGHCIAGLC